MRASRDDSQVKQQCEHRLRNLNATLPSIHLEVTISVAGSKQNETFWAFFLWILKADLLKKAENEEESSDDEQKFVMKLKDNAFPS